MERSKYWDKMVDILEDAFPKGECKERGKAIVMLSYIEMMLLKESEKEICICAAVLTEDGIVVKGHRHCDCFMVMEHMGKKPKYDIDYQGFITSKGRYVNREEGRKLQDKAGILSVDREGYRGDTLYSEDLY
jgi:hypothetical protein